MGARSTSSGTFSMQPAVEAHTIDQLASLQIAVLPDSLVSRLGLGYVRSFYRYALASSLEQVLWRRCDGEVSAACVVSFSPQSLMRRLLLHTPLAYSAVTHLPSLPVAGIVKELWMSLSAADRYPDDLPEMLMLFTHPQLRSTGLGTALLREMEEVLKRTGVSQYRVKTFDHPDHPALRFYVRNGFRPQASTLVYGQRYRILEKILNTTQRQQTGPA